MTEPAEKLEGIEKIISLNLPSSITGKERDKFFEIIEIAKSIYSNLEAKNIILANENDSLKKRLNMIKKERDAYKQEVKELIPLTVTDKLTGLHDHGYFVEQLEDEIKRCKRYDSSVFSLAMMDIDHFKKFNDTYGHQAGDYVLEEVANTAKDVFREADILARYGGEEFAVIMPGTDEEAANYAAERFRSTLENFDLKYDGQDLDVTISIGVTQYRDPDDCIVKLNDDGHDKEKRLIMQMADDLLYFAKKKGRNCTVSYDSVKKDLIFLGYLSEKYQDASNVEIIIPQ